MKELVAILLICSGIYQYRGAGFVRWTPVQTFVIRASCPGFRQHISAVPLTLKFGGK